MLPRLFALIILAVKASAGIASEAGKEEQASEAPTYVCSSKVGAGLALEGYDYVHAEFSLNNLSFMLVPWQSEQGKIWAEALQGHLPQANPTYLVQEIGRAEPVAVCEGQGLLLCIHFITGISQWNLQNGRFEVLMSSNYISNDDRGERAAGAIQGTCKTI